MQPRKATFTAGHHRWIRQWRAALCRHAEKTKDIPSDLWELDLGDRARLRRAKDVHALVGDPAVYLLVRGLAEEWPRGREPDNRDYDRLGIVAGVLALTEDVPAAGSVKGNDDKRPRIQETLARRLGRPERGKEPVMSEIRFRQLEAATDYTVLFRLWRRAIQLAGKQADVAFLADDLYTWLLEIDHPTREPSSSVRFHWAYDYYQQPRGNAPSGTSTPEAEIPG